MGSLRRRLLVLGLFLAAVGRSGSSSSPHSLRYFYTALSQPGQGLPLFSIVGYVDDQLIDKYDSDTRRTVPQAPWMEKAVKDDPQYWETETQLSQNAESVFRGDFETMLGRYNQSRGGLHILQTMYGCEVGSDGGFKGGYSQDAYDGEDFIALDLKTFTWTARVPQALETKRKWEHHEVHESQRSKDYLQEICAPWLRRYLDYGRESLLRTEAPAGRVARKVKEVGLETLVCRLDGFYPNAIEVTWMKDGVDQISETLTGGVVPHSDGTYHTWRSIDIDPKERGLYRCHVEHDSLPEPLDLAWEEPATPWGLVLGIVIGISLAVAILIGVIVFLKKQRGMDYRAAANSVHA